MLQLTVRHSDPVLENTQGSYYRARYYDPATGRFLREDPIGFDAGTNFYPYVGNSPPNFWDPRGRQACCGLFAAKYTVYGAIGGAGFAALGSIVVDAGTGGLNILATPAEIALGGVVGGFVGYGLGTIADLLTGNYCSSSNPFRGKPGDTSTTRGRDGTPKQTRRYGPDGYPDTDVDFDHDHGQGRPHGHDWGRPADGGPPTADDRSPGRPVTPSDPRPE